MIRLELILWVPGAPEASLPRAESCPILCSLKLVPACLFVSTSQRKARVCSAGGPDSSRLPSSRKLSLSGHSLFSSGTFIDYFPSDVNLPSTPTPKLRGHPLRFIVYTEYSVLCHADHPVASEAANIGPIHREGGETVCVFLYCLGNFIMLSFNCCSGSGK